MVPKIDVLVGEESKRKFEWKVIVTNPNAVSDKENALRDDIKQKLLAILQQKYSGDDEAVKQKLEAEVRKLEDYANYTWQDLREMRGSMLLKHYYAEQDFDRIFNDGFKDVLIHAEEIYECAIVSNEPRLYKLNPLKVHVVRTSHSSRIEDSDIIIIDDHWSPGKIIDTYYNELKPKDIDTILEYSTLGSDGRDWEDEYANSFIYVGGSNKDGEMLDSVVATAEINGHSFSADYQDEDGNIRVLRVFWRSQRKIKKVKYYNPDGTVDYKIMTEEYEVKENLGEEEEVLWVNEWWEGTKIGKEIYVNMRPRPVQYTKMYSPSEGNPGIVGELYNTNQGKAVSLVSRMKSYQYLYDSIWDRLNKAIAKNMGKIMEVDVAKIPANWEVGKWLHYASTMGIGIVDSFKEGNKGASMGKLAGTFNTTGKVLDLETGNYIQQHIGLLEFIKQEMSEIAGITQQRQGNISNRETVGGVERSVVQSSHITEWWFAKHTNLKIRILNVFLETAKAALKGHNKKLQYILDDTSIKIFDINGDEFAESDYGIIITSDQSAEQMQQKLDGLAQAAIQSQTLKFSDLLYIYNSSSLSDIRRKIEKSEIDIENQRAQEGQAQQEELQARKEEAAQQLAMENRREDSKLQIEVSKIELDRLKIEVDARLREMEMNLKAGIDNEKVKADLVKLEEELKIKEAELDEEIRSNKAKEKIDRVNKKPIKQ